ncbi:hypothetical protein [Psychromonas sp. KJ10-2]|uniref:hypothetical protein n=1 Tax=Psychromonas sp. KJ10-2 TaxID=3391822 RepID=UPI0039B6186B
MILDNPRWVIKGQLYDMFQNTALSSSTDLIEAETKIPFNKLKIDTVNIFGFTANPTKPKELIVFIDPFLDISSNAIDVINAATNQYRVRYILTPFTQSSVKRLFAFSCVIKGEKSSQIIKRIKYKSFGSTSGVCDQDLISKTYGVSAFLKLKKSPTLIASNDVASHGLPQSIVAFLARNME